MYIESIIPALTSGEFTIHKKRNVHIIFAHSFCCLHEVSVSCLNKGITIRLYGSTHISLSVS